MSNRKHIKQEDFDNIKFLQKEGLKVPSASRISGRSATTVKRIYKADNLASYHEYMASLRTADTSVGEVERHKPAALNPLNTALEELNQAVERVLMGQEGIYQQLSDIRDTLKMPRLPLE